MLILAMGDVVGSPGRQAVQKLLPGLRQQYGIDLVIANSENLAGGFGLTSNTAKEMFNAGVDVLTSGDHIWKKREIFEIIQQEERILRPLNFPLGAPGRGAAVLAPLTAPRSE